MSHQEQEATFEERQAQQQLDVQAQLLAQRVAAMDANMDTSEAGPIPIFRSSNSFVPNSNTASIPTPLATQEVEQVRNDFVSAMSNLTFKIKEPPKYGGKRANDAARVWFSRMELHFLQIKVIQKVELETMGKVLIAVGYLESHALEWHILTFVKNSFPITSYEH